MNNSLTDLPCLCVYFMAVGKGMPALLCCIVCHCCKEARKVDESIRVFVNVGLTGLNCRVRFKFYGGVCSSIRTSRLQSELHTNCPAPSYTKKVGKGTPPQ